MHLRAYEQRKWPRFGFQRIICEVTFQRTVAELVICWRIIPRHFGLLFEYVYQRILNGVMHCIFDVGPWRVQLHRILSTARRHRSPLCCRCWRCSRVMVIRYHVRVFISISGLIPPRTWWNETERVKVKFKRSSTLCLAMIPSPVFVPRRREFGQHEYKHLTICGVLFR